MARLAVRLTPSGGRDAITGVRDGVLQVRVKAPAEGGKANEALLRLLGRAFDEAAPRILTGATMRRKLIDLPALDDAALAARLAALLPAG